MSMIISLALKSRRHVAKLQNQTFNAILTFKEGRRIRARRTTARDLRKKQNWGGEEKVNRPTVASRSDSLSHGCNKTYRPRFVAPIE
jgi:hypothetical protein